MYFFKLYKCNILIKYYDQEFLIYNELDLNSFVKNIQHTVPARIFSTNNPNYLHQSTRYLKNQQ